MSSSSAIQNQTNREITFLRACPMCWTILEESNVSQFCEPCSRRSENATSIHEEQDQRTDLVGEEDGSPNFECPVCLEHKSKADSELTYCKHRFCSRCFDICVVQSNSCPLCRQVMVPPDEGYVYIDTNGNLAPEWFAYHHANHFTRIRLSELEDYRNNLPSTQ